VFDDHLDQPMEVPPQIAELTGHLKRRRDQLQAKEAKLNEKIALWQQTVDLRSAATSDRERELKKREQHLRSLQFHLLQMQNDIVDSQLSMEGVIEHFENTDSDEYMKLALEMLRFEVLERFDYISKRWEMLHDKLENLYAEQPQRKVA
jgi:TolA-binding protein